MKRPIVITIILLLTLSQIALARFFLRNDDNFVYDFSPKKLFAKHLPANELKDLPIHYAYFSSEDYYNESYQDTPEHKAEIPEKIYGGIVPHHLFVNKHIAGFFKNLEGQAIETVVLISPNHFESGNEPIITSEAKWQTPFGELLPDLYLLRKISGLEHSEINEEPFVNEHGITGLVGFIKKSLPESYVVPIILSAKLDEKQAEELAKTIYKNVDPKKTLVISSVDFSHYQTALTADFHDERSNNIIETFDLPRIYSMEIDSPASIYTLEKYLEYIKARQATFLYHTNSAQLAGKPDEPSTSHSFYYFSQGEPSDERLVNFLFFGDLMLDRYVKTKIEQEGFDYLFEKMAGGEKRFFSGIDIISANLEGAVTDEGKHFDPVKAYDFAFEPETVKKLKKYNFNYFTVANNHLYDQGSLGVDETRKNLLDMGFNFSGSPDRRLDDFSLYIKEVAGKRIGFLSFSMVSGTVDKDKLLELLRKSEAESDLTIINVHWGVEYAHRQNGLQKSIAHELIDNGADLIIGHHPHVVQGMEVYKDKYIFYSLGNFIFDQYFSADTQEGLAVGVTWVDDGLEFELFPFRSVRGQVELLVGKEREGFLGRLEGWSEGGVESLK